MIFVLLKVLTCIVCAVPISLKGGAPKVPVSHISKAEEYTNGAVKNKIGKKSFIKAINSTLQQGYIDTGTGVCRIDGDSRKGFGHWGASNAADDAEAAQRCDADGSCLAFWKHPSGGYQFFCSVATSLCGRGSKGVTNKPSDLRGSGLAGDTTCFIKSATQEYPYTEDSSKYCISNWVTDWSNRVVGKTVDQCKDLCSVTTGCSMITHGTHGGVENNCVLCTGDGTLADAAWTTTYSKIVSDRSLDWRVFTYSTYSREIRGLENCWDVNEIAFFSDILCSNPIEIAPSARISSGSEGDSIDSAFDGVLDQRGWVGRSTDGNFGSKEVWIGVLDIDNLKCIELTQGDSSSNYCRPYRTMLIQKRIPGTTNWITEIGVQWTRNWDSTTTKWIVGEGAG